jgi:RNA polymerase sigma-70 factor (ECF subfamily)
MNDDTPLLDRTVQAAWRDFQTHYEPLRPTLYRFARHLTRSPWDAEDLVQDTLARAFATLGSLLEPPREPRAWLFRVASNLWIDRVRRAIPPPPGPEEEGGVSSRAVREAAGTLLVQLAPQERAAVVLKDAFDLSLEDIADILSTTVGAVKAALHRGRGKLADPDVELPRTPASGALDAFCEAFNAGDLDRVAALLLDNATVEVVGASTIHGKAKARTTVLPGMLLGSARMAAPEDGGRDSGIDPRFAQGVLPRPARGEVRRVHGEPVLLSWYQHRDGEFVRAVTRVDVDAESGRIARLWNYFFTPEIIAEICSELGLPHRTNGTFRAR